MQAVSQRYSYSVGLQPYMFLIRRSADEAACVLGNCFVVINLETIYAKAEVRV